MERLTTREEHPHGAEGRSENNLTGNYCRGVFEATAVVERLAHYENLEDDGKLLALPCKPGDTVYVMNDDCECPGDCYQSQTCKSCEYRNLYIDEEVATLSFIIDNIDNFGKTVFLTEKEALEALEGIKHEKA